MMQLKKYCFLSFDYSRSPHRVANDCDFVYCFPSFWLITRELQTYFVPTKAMWYIVSSPFDYSRTPNIIWPRTAMWWSDVRNIKDRKGLKTMPKHFLGHDSLFQSSNSWTADFQREYTCWCNIFIISDPSNYILYIQNNLPKKMTEWFLKIYFVKVGYRKIACRFAVSGFICYE